MNVRDLLDLRVICQAGSLRKAAEALGVTQPTLSNRIARLEDQLGSALFDRSSGRSRPTELALFIAARAGALASEADALVRDATRIAGGRSGLVRIGIGVVPLKMLLTDMAPPIEESIAGCSLELITGHTAQLADNLLQRRLDMVVSAPMDGGRDSIQSELLLDVPIIVVAHPDHPLCATPPADLHSLFQYPFASTVLEQHYRNLLHGQGIEFERLDGRLVCSDYELLIRAVARRAKLFTAGPRIVFEQAIAAGRLRVVDFEAPFRHRIHLHSVRDTYPLPAVIRAQEYLRRAFRSVQEAASGVS